MAAHTPENTAVGAALKTAQEQQAQASQIASTGQIPAQPQQPQMNQQAYQAWSLDTALVEEGLTPSSSSDALASFELALAGMKPSNKAAPHKLLSLDNHTETNWRYGSVILAVQDPATKTVAVLPIVIEASETEAIEARTIRLANSDRTVTVVPLPSDAMDVDYVARILELAGEAFGAPKAAVKYVPGILLPKTFVLTDAAAIQRVLARVSKSCRDYLLDARPGTADMLNLARLQGGGLLSVRPMNSRGDVVDTVGLPVRQDLEIVLSSGRQNDQQQNTNQLDQAFRVNGTAQSEKRFGRLGAFIDFRMLPPAQQQVFTPNFDPRNLTRRFVAETVLTSVDLYQMSTTAALMLMLSFAVSATQPNVIRSMLYQRQQASNMLYKNASFNPANMGMLNLYAGYGMPAGAAAPAPYDLQSATSTPRDFLEYLDNILDPGVAVSIDIPRLGTQASYLSVLGACARGDADALAFLKTTLDSYTNGQFSTILFGPGRENSLLQADHVFSERLNSVYNGYFPMKVGDEIRDVDIRHIDLNAMIANFAQRDPEQVIKYVQSFMVNNIDPMLRMANRREAIEAYTNESAVFNGISERNTFRVDFLSALAQCNAANNFKPQLSFNDQLANTNTGVVAPGFMQGGLWTGQVQGLYGQAQGQVTGFGGAYVNNTVGRF